MFGNPETTTGGNALKFYSSVRLEIRSAGKLEGNGPNGKELVGNRVKVKVVKNKIAPPFKVAEFDIMFNKGISYEGDLLDLAERYSVARKAGAFYSYEDKTIGQGRENTKRYLQENPEVSKKMHKEVVEQIKSNLV